MRHLKSLKYLYYGAGFAFSFLIAYLIARKPSIAFNEKAFFAALLFIAFSITIIIVGSLFSQTDTEKTWQVKRFDWILLIIIALCATYFFNHSYDIPITIKHAKTLIEATSQGNFFDYYTIVYEKAIAGEYIYGTAIDGANYNILLYLLLALAILPLYLLEQVFNISINSYIYIIYVKSLLSLAYMFSGNVLLRLVKTIGFSVLQERNASFLYLSSPILLLANIAFGQFDFISSAILIIALQFYVKGRYFTFSAITSVAIAFKLFPIVAFLPLILMIEKRVWIILLHILIGLSVTIVTRLMFINDTGYTLTKEFMSSKYGFINRIFVEKIGSVSILMVVFVGLCIFAYAHKAPTSPTERAHCSVHLSLASFSLLFAWLDWHSQWVVHIVPFLVIAILLSDNRRFMMLLSCVLSFTFLIRAGFRHIHNADNYMINGGILPRIFGRTYTGPPIKSLIAKLPYADEITKSIFCALLLCFAFIAIKSIKDQPTPHSADKGLEHGLVYTQIAIIAGCFMAYISLYFLRP